MRVALLSHNARQHDAVGSMLVERVRFFTERGAEVRLFVEDGRHLHPDLQACCVVVSEPTTQGPAWDYLHLTDLVLAMYPQTYDLLQWLPCLAGGCTRIVLDYLGVTPPSLWPDQHRERLEASERHRGVVWCADHALAISGFTRDDLSRTTQFPSAYVTTLPPVTLDARFRAEPRERFWQRKLGIDGRILLYVGRFAGNKRVPIVIEAVARLNDRSLHAVLVGDHGDVYAAEAHQCLTRAEKLGVADRVHLVGQLDDADLPRAYRSADVLVLPSVHEGFGIPVIEAMACGVPVVASRSAALPETVGPAGVTFVPDDADDLARQLRRVLEAKTRADASGSDRRRVAVVSFRFGPDIVGGAETSLRTMASALHDAGHHVEVFTTCTTRESHWTNDVPAGSVTLDGLTVHRFPIDAHDSAAHGEAFRAILDGAISSLTFQALTERRYLDNSIHSSALIAALRRRADEFDAILVGPYLFGLTADIVQTFTNKTLLVPCFHDEPLARLSVWPTLYSEVGGILYHSAEERVFAQRELGVHHPNAREIGTCLPSACGFALQRAPANAKPQAAYVVYCGRYSEQKNVPLLLEWLRRYQADYPDQLDVVFMGQGHVALPTEPWLRDLGHVDEATKRSVLGDAESLVQMSTHESLSIVVVEAWAAGTPVVVHGDCPVLVGQIERAQGGRAVADYEAFADTLNDLIANAADWRRRGADGLAFVAEHYQSPGAFVGRLLEAIGTMCVPLHEQMRERGLAYARNFTRAAWQRQFAEMIEKVLTQPARSFREDVRVEALRTDFHGGCDTKTLLVPVRVTNAGTHAALPDGPGRTVIACEVRDANS